MRQRRVWSRVKGVAREWHGQVMKPAARFRRHWCAQEARALLGFCAQERAAARILGGLAFKEGERFGGERLFLRWQAGLSSIGMAQGAAKGVCEGFTASREEGVAGTAAVLHEGGTACGKGSARQGYCAQSIKKKKAARRCSGCVHRLKERWQAGVLLEQRGRGG